MRTDEWRVKGTRGRPLLVRIVYLMVQAGIAIPEAAYAARVCIDDFKSMGTLMQTYQYGRVTFTLQRRRKC